MQQSIIHTHTHTRTCIDVYITEGTNLKDRQVPKKSEQEMPQALNHESMSK